MTLSYQRALALSIISAAALSSGAAARLGAQARPAALTVQSTAFQNNQAIPAKYGADGAGVTPPLTWTGAPASTKEFTVIVEDLDNGNIHWTLYKIPAAVKGLPEGVPAGGTLGASAGALAGAMQGPAAQGGRGGRGGAPGGAPGGQPAGGPPAAAPPPAEPRYRPPAPPAGMPHHYKFTVYALDAAIDAMPGMTKPALVQAMTGHIVAQGDLTGIYARGAPAP